LTAAVGSVASSSRMKLTFSPPTVVGNRDTALRVSAPRAAAGPVRRPPRRR
jgi:hypothetical protein